MTEIDPESKAFLIWVREKLKDRDFFDELIASIIINLRNIYAYPDKELFIKGIIRKMEKGAAEHGPPKGSEKAIFEEILMEAQDLIGWTLMAEYAAKNK